MSLDPTLAELIELGVREALAETFTAITGRVVAYDAATRTADVQPATKRAIETEAGDLRLESYPLLPSVPVIFPMSGPAGEWSITFPIPVGTWGLILILSDNDHAWRETGENETGPGDRRRHALGCAKFLPGYLPDATALPAAEESAMVLAGDEVRLGAHTATDFIALAPAIKSQLDDIMLWLVNHVHSGVTAGAAATGPSNSGYVSSDVAATKVKAV